MAYGRGRAKALSEAEAVKDVSQKGDKRQCRKGDEKKAGQDATRTAVHQDSFRGGGTGS